MRYIPASVLLTWPKPNYADPETRGSALLVTNIVLLVLVLVFLVLRVYTRLLLQRWFGSDDVFIIIAFILTASFTTIILLAEQDYGWNRHVWDVMLGDIEDVLIFGFIVKLLFGLTTSCIRISFLCFYHRLVSRTATTWFRAATHAVWIYVVSLCIAAVFLTVLTCQLIKAYWTFPAMPNSKCLNDGLVGVILGSLHCLADLLVTLLPVPVILSLKLPGRVRFATLVLLQLGIVVTIAGALRTYYVWVSYNDTYDSTWASYPVWFLAAVEINLGMICACIPACRPLFIKVIVPPLSIFGSKFTASKPAKDRRGPASSQAVLPTGQTGASAEAVELPGVEEWQIMQMPKDDTDSEDSRLDRARPWPIVRQSEIGIAV